MNQNEELHQRTLVALARAAQAPLMTEDDLSLLMWHCGITDRKDVERTPVFVRPIKEAA